MCIIIIARTIIILITKLHVQTIQLSDLILDRDCGEDRSREELFIFWSAAPDRAQRYNTHRRRGCHQDRSACAQKETLSYSSGRPETADKFTVFT